MTEERYNLLQNDMSSKLTEEEFKEGWRFCCELDGALIKTQDYEFCTCKGEEK